MPFKPLRPCRYPGCKKFSSEPYCEDHRIMKERRGSSSERGYNARWRHARGVFLSKHPLCVECLKQGRLVPATVVDHIVPHRGDSKLFWDETNWQALCEKCHDEKTGKGL